MENELFIWDGWDKVDTSAYIFYKVTLVKDVGSHSTGTFFDSAYVDYQKGILSFYNNGPMVDGVGKTKEISRFKINLVVASELPTVSDEDTSVE